MKIANWLMSLAVFFGVGIAEAKDYTVGLAQEQKDAKEQIVFSNLEDYIKWREELPNEDNIFVNVYQGNYHRTELNSDGNLLKILYLEKENFMGVTNPILENTFSQSGILEPNQEGAVIEGRIYLHSNSSLENLILRVHPELDGADRVRIQPKEGMDSVSNVEVSNCYFIGDKGEYSYAYGGIGLYGTNVSNIFIRDNIFNYSEQYGFGFSNSDFYTTENAPVLTGNLFYDCREGIYSLSYNYFSLGDLSKGIEGNNIFTHCDYSLNLAETSGTISAEMNYWYSSDGVLLTNEEDILSTINDRSFTSPATLVFNEYSTNEKIDVVPFQTKHPYSKESTISRWSSYE